jgi:RimJ/RimL family protein N-acetyltransferase
VPVFPGWNALAHLNEYEGSPGGPLAVISRSTTGEPVGNVNITRVDWHHRRASSGYRILARHRRHGYALAPPSASCPP